MPRYEYKVVPAPRKGQKIRGVRSSEARFALALEQAMNEMSAEGWEYQRAETLPCEERQGLTSRTTVFHNVLVFRRALPEAGMADDAKDAGEEKNTPALRPEADNPPSEEERKEPALPRLGGATRAGLAGEDSPKEG
jgi:hypothetical protein